MTEEISDWNRQRGQYQESLKQVINKL
jgi:hypothetical protein